MALRIFHTADCHIGMKFLQYQDSRERLVQARMATLEAAVAQADERRCDLFVVAGDLFDRLTVAAQDVERAAQALGRFSGVVAVLPGNHDYCAAEADELWARFEKAAPDNVLVLRQARPYDLPELSTVLYPGPCDSKHSMRHAVGWIEGAARPSDRRFHVGIAHGSLEGVSPDLAGNYFPMRPADLTRLGLDAFLLGHTHRPYPLHPSAEDRIYFPGVHEPDGMDCAHGGGAWVLELRDDRCIDAQYVADLGQYRFLRVRHELAGAADLEGLAAHLDGLTQRPTLLELALVGRLDDDTRAALAEVLNEARDRFVWFEVDTSGLGRRIDLSVVERDHAEGSFAHTLLTQLCRDAADEDALQAAYELLEEARA